MICLIAKLSDEATEKLRALREGNVQPVRTPASVYGHITIATYLPEEDAAFIEACADLIRGFRPFSVRYQTVRVLPETSVIVAAPEKSAELLALHRGVTDRFGSALDRWTGRENWLPHTTLVYDPAADLEAVCREMNERFVPFDARVERLELSRVTPDGYTIIRP